MLKRFLCSIALAALVTGCEPTAAPSAKPADPQAPKPADTAAAKPTEAPAPTGAKKRIAVIPKSVSHQFWVTVKTGAEAAGKEFGADIVWQGTAKETDVTKQMDIVQDMISSKVDAIVMAATNETALVPKVEQAIQAGIPVITIDSGVNSEAPLSFVATDNIAGAKTAADVLAKLIGEEGNVGSIPFVSGAATSELREKGFKEGLAAHPNVKLVATLYSQSDVALGMNVTQDMLTANPDLKGIFGANEGSALGAAQALRAAGKAGQVKLVAFDAAPAEIEALKEGVIQALIVQKPFTMGYLGVKAAMDAIAKKPVEKRIDTGVTVVTLENLNTPEVQKLLNPS